MARIWTDQRKFETWLEIELMACEALAELGEISREAVQEIKEKSKFVIRRIDEMEKVTKHDVLAFLTNVGKPSVLYPNTFITDSPPPISWTPLSLCC
jgi:adenylosuccinate lyase